jgi:N-acetyl-anhydromuramyl-L-alanine amidase AmpD
MSNFPIKRIVVHCTATREGQDVSAATIKGWHLKQGWSDIGYHYVVRLDGRIEKGRPDTAIGSHVRGWNKGSIAIVYVGGLDSNGKAKDTRTAAQKKGLKEIINRMSALHKNPPVMGHRDLSPDKDGDGVVEKNEWLKMCPCFDVRDWIKQGMPI